MILQLKLFSVSLISFLVIDFIWLALVAKGFYVKHLNDIGRFENGSLKPVMWAAIAVYVIMSLGLIYFVMPKVRFESSWIMVFLIGAFFGFVAYGIYDMTNMATLKDWNVQLALADMAWGSFLCGLVTVITKFVST